MTYYTRILKSNDNHDAKGQFASGSAASKNIGKGVAKIVNQTIANEKKFPHGSMVKPVGSTSSSDYMTVIGHNGPMVTTDRGDYHHTKITAAG